jgi:hypothetical protein
VKTVGAKGCDLFGEVCGGNVALGTLNGSPVDVACERARRNMLPNKIDGQVCMVGSNVNNSATLFEIRQSATQTRRRSGYDLHRSLLSVAFVVKIGCRTQSTAPLCQLLLFSQELVDSLYQSVGIGSVCSTGSRNAFTAGCRAAQAMHANGKEELRGFAIVIKNVAYDGLLCNFHFAISFLWVNLLYTYDIHSYYNLFWVQCQCLFGDLLKKAAKKLTLPIAPVLTTEKKTDIIYVGVKCRIDGRKEVCACAKY